MAGGPDGAACPPNRHGRASSAGRCRRPVKGIGFEATNASGLNDHDGAGHVTGETLYWPTMRSFSQNLTQKPMPLQAPDAELDGGERDEDCKCGGEVLSFFGEAPVGAEPREHPLPGLLLSIRHRK
jgi:hypothetical protein